MRREPYPLDWPEGWTRTPEHRRAHPKFDGSFARARDGLLAEIRRLGGTKSLITCNMPTRRDGLPYADGRITNGDPGVAVYWWQMVGSRVVERVMACDRWRNVGHNMRALALSIEALRGLERWGGSTIVDRAFQSFAALPPAPSDWRAMLGNPGSIDAARSAYRRLALEAHPDHGGDADRMSRLNEAWDAAQKDLSP